MTGIRIQSLRGYHHNEYLVVFAERIYGLRNRGQIVRVSRIHLSPGRVKIH